MSTASVTDPAANALPSPWAFAQRCRSAELALVDALARVRLKHVLWAVLALCCSVGVAEAQTEPEQAGVIATLGKYLPQLAAGFGMNVFIGIASTALGTLAGFLLGFGQLSRARPVRSLAVLATQFFRNAPTMVLLFYIAASIPPELDVAGATIVIPGWLKAVVAIALSVMSNTSEVVRGAVASIPRGQWDGAFAVGMGRWQAMRMIVMPQCIELMIPPLLGYFIIIVMATTLASVVGVQEVLSEARLAISIEEGRDELLAPMYLLVMAMFFAFSYTATLGVRRLQRSLRARHAGGRP